MLRVVFLNVVLNGCFIVPALGDDAAAGRPPSDPAGNNGLFDGSRTRLFEVVP